MAESEAMFFRIAQSINGNRIAELSKAQLQEFASAMCLSQAYTHFTDRQFPQVCETIRLALVLRVSEEANAEATRISKIALAVSLFALIAGIAQVAAVFIHP